MSAKKIAYGEEARRAILDGVSVLSRAVKATLGPKGRNAMLDKPWGSPTVTKDGVTVAKEIELTEPYQNMGAQMVKQVASKTCPSRKLIRPDSLVNYAPFLVKKEPIFESQGSNMPVNSVTKRLDARIDSVVLLTLGRAP